MSENKKITKCYNISQTDRLITNVSCLDSVNSMACKSNAVHYNLVFVFLMYEVFVYFKVDWIIMIALTVLVRHLAVLQLHRQPMMI